MDIAPLESRSIAVVDVVLRDGLQAVREIVPMDVRLQVVEILADAGLTHVELTSFVRPDVVPQFGESEALITAVRARHAQRLRLSGLTANAAGVVRAMAAGIDEIVHVVPASDEYARRNQKRTSAELMDELARGLTEAGRQFERPAVTLAIATAFSCPYTGPIARETIAALVVRAGDIGADRVQIADTYGGATPQEITSALSTVRGCVAPLPVSVHLHTRTSSGEDEIRAALAGGVDRIDGSMNGLGGGIAFPDDQSPPRNVPTQTVVRVLASEGLATDTQVRSVDEAASRVATVLAPYV